MRPPLMQASRTLLSSLLTWSGGGGGGGGCHQECEKDALSFSLERASRDAAAEEEAHVIMITDCSSFPASHTFPPSSPSPSPSETSVPSRVAATCATWILRRKWVLKMDPRLLLLDRRPAYYILLMLMLTRFLPDSRGRSPVRLAYADAGAASLTDDESSDSRSSLITLPSLSRGFSLSLSLSLTWGRKVCLIQTFPCKHES